MALLPSIESKPGRNMSKEIVYASTSLDAYQVILIFYIESNRIVKDGSLFECRHPVCVERIAGVPIR
jgi:hypothetical protein